MRPAWLSLIVGVCFVMGVNKLVAQPRPVKLNKGLFGLAKPDFGPYKTVSIAKIDSATRRTKTTGEFDIRNSSSGTIDLSKITTSKVTKMYELVLQDTSQFSIEFAVEELSKEKHETAAGIMFGKQDGSGDETLSRQRNMAGQVLLANKVALFYVHGLSFPSPQLPPGFLSIPLIENAVIYFDPDSLLVKNSGSMQAVIINSKNVQLASITFQSRKPTVNIDASATPAEQRIIAGLFAAIVAVKDY